MKDFQSYITRKEKEFGDKFDPSDLALHFVKYYESGERIEIKTAYGEVKRGRIGITTGWKPVFLLMSRRNTIGSSETLSRHDKVLRTICA
jgi:hypothetical protein